MAFDFRTGGDENVGGGVTDASPEGVTDLSPKESQIEESHVEEKKGDLDYPSTNRKNRDSRTDGSAGDCKLYPRLREALADYMVTEEDSERICPSDRHVVDVMDAAAGASEEEVMRCLRYLREERRLLPGTKNGPRSFPWFRTVVAEYFQQKRNRETVFSPAGHGRDCPSSLSEEEFDSMTEPIETA